MSRQVNTLDISKDNLFWEALFPPKKIIRAESLEHALERVKLMEKEHTRIPTPKIDVEILGFAQRVGREIAQFGSAQFKKKPLSPEFRDDGEKVLLVGIPSPTVNLHLYWELKNEPRRAGFVSGYSLGYLKKVFQNFDPFAVPELKWGQFLTPDIFVEKSIVFKRREYNLKLFNYSYLGSLSGIPTIEAHYREI